MTDEASTSLLIQRLRAAGMSLWELGDLIGVHPHHLFPDNEDLAALPVAALVDLASRLDLHPADLVPDLDPDTSPATQDKTLSAAGTVENATSVSTDAEVVLTALAYAVDPLTNDDLAAALDWPLARVATAIEHAHRHPEQAGPVRLRRTAPDTYTVTARLDRLTADQAQRLARTRLYRHALTADQAQLLLAALALNNDPGAYRSRRTALPDAEPGLKRAGLIQDDNGAGKPRVVNDVRYSLRYHNQPPGD